MLKKVFFFLLLPVFLLSHDFYRWKDYKIAYVEKGKGDEHVLLLHGFAANIFTWHYQTDFLARQGYHVWAVDFIGFGQSDKPSEDVYGLDLYQGQIISFMNKMGIKKAHVIGHSMGGAIGLWLAVKNPDRLNSLIVVDPASYPFEWPALLQVCKRYGRYLEPFINRRAICFILGQIFFDRKKVTQRQIDAYWEPIKRGGKQSLLRVLEAFDNQILAEMCCQYSTIKVPVLVVWGEEDRWIPVSCVALFARDIPHADQAIIKKAGHAPQEEKPGVFNEQLLAFLKNHPFTKNES